MMHGQKNIKLCNAEQAKRVYKYKNIKLKLYKNNAAIWYMIVHRFPGWRYQRLWWYNWSSWWRAACCSKHVEGCSV